MTVTVDLRETQILTVLRAFLLDILPPPIEVVRGLVNRVPQVMGPDYVVMTPGARIALSTPAMAKAGLGAFPDKAAYKQPMEVHIQLDVYGPIGAENAHAIVTLFRTSYAWEFFARQGLALAPLYPDDPKRIPFVNEEDQYEDRWIVDAILQANPVTTTVQQYAETVTVGLIEVDTTYPPGDA